MRAATAAGTEALHWQLEHVPMTVVAEKSTECGFERRAIAVVHAHVACTDAGALAERRTGAVQ